MKSWRLLTAIFVMSAGAPLVAMQTGVWGPSTSTSATLTLAALGGAGSTGQQDRYCVTNLEFDANIQGSAACILTIASASSNLYVASISTNTISPIVESWPAPVGGTQEPNLCGTAGQSMTFTVTGCTGSGYHINASGYTDR